MNDVIIMNGKDFVAKLNEAIQLLEENGYKVTAPPKEVKDEYTFERAWNLYEKKVGCKAKLEKKWNSMSQKDRKAAIEYIPLYVIATEDKNIVRTSKPSLTSEDGKTNSSEQHHLQQPLTRILPKSVNSSQRRRLNRT